MCDPLTIAGVGLTAASSLASASASDQVGAARTGVMNAETRRQGNFDNESTGVNNTARDRYADFGGKEDARAREVADFYKANSSGLPDSGPTAGAIPASTSNIVVQEGKKQAEKVGAFNTQQNQASAKLRGFGDVMATASRGTAQDAGRLGLINSFRRGSSAVVPLEMESANRAGDGTKMLADILGGVGKVSTFAGLSGVGQAAPSSPAEMARPHGSTVISSGKGWLSRLFG